MAVCRLRIIAISELPAIDRRRVLDEGESDKSLHNSWLTPLPFFFLFSFYLSSSLRICRLRFGLSLLGGSGILLLGALLFGRCFSCLLLLLAFLFLRGQSLELKSVDAPLQGHLISQQGVDHSMACRLHLGRKHIGDDD